MAEIRICDRNNKLLCSHRRSYTNFPKYITKPEHMKPEHQYYRDVNSKDGNYYRRWAASQLWRKRQIYRRLAIALKR